MKEDKRTMVFCQVIFFSHCAITNSMIVFTFLLFFIGLSEELNNGLGRTPQMGKRKKDSLTKKTSIIFFIIEGWNSWNHFHCTINETVVRQTADTLVATGLAAAGYEYGLF
jgi:alpha-galactosidase